MKIEQLQTKNYQLIVKGYQQWLSTLGYSESTVYGSPRQVAEFLYWLEQQEVTVVGELTKQHFNDFLEYFKYRPNKRTGEGISSGHINKQINSLTKLVEYLKLNKKINFSLHLKQVTDETVKRPTVLSRQEIEALYQATSNNIIGIRDRAMLAVYYGCGLRKSEGLFLELSDVLFDKKQLYIRKAKNGYERYVPIPIKGLQDLERYMYSARPLLLDNSSKTEALFISEKGTPMHPESMIKRLQALRDRTTFSHKKFGLHALRHSVATHLLQAGMELENIALFLGHKTLDSTQVYTHVINELEQ